MRERPHRTAASGLTIMRKAFVLIVLALAHVVAWAVACTEYRVSLSGFVGTWAQSKASACAQISGYTFNGGYTRYINPRVDGAGNCAVDKQALYDPGGWTNEGSTSTSFEEQQNPNCVPESDCTSKKDKNTVLNWTAGWQRTPSVSASEPLVNANPIRNPYQPVCNQGCTAIIDRDGPGAGLKSWVSQTATGQGLYRVSIEFNSTYTGASCNMSAADNPIKPDNSIDPPCPGYVGDVNGVKGCYGTADRPVTTTPSTVPRDRPQDTGNPAAGPKPTSGTGSGTTGASVTPTTGTGGSAGGPSAAAGARAGQQTGTSVTGRVGTGSGTGTEQQNCGAPGQPKCDVKVDETGTPATGDFSEAKTGLDTAKDSAQQAMQNAHGMQAPSWSFTFALPVGCSPYALGGGFDLSIDVCQWQGIIHQLMSMIWAAATVFCIIGMVGRTIRES